MGSSSLTLYPLLFVFNVYVATKINIKSQGCRSTHLTQLFLGMLRDLKTKHPM